MASSVMVVALGGLTHCGGVDISSKPTERAAAPSPPPAGLAQEVRAGGDLVFPPAQKGRRDRPPLPATLTHAKAPEPLALAYPASGGQLEMEGRSVTVSFNKPMEGAAYDAPAGQLVVVRQEEEKAAVAGPVVAGNARWIGDRDLTFTANAFLDPAKPYTLTLTGLKGAGGESLGTTALTLVARTGAVIAGKALGHVPVPGQLRPVAVAPFDAAAHPRTQFTALYDQPIALGDAKSRVQLADAKGNVVKTVLRHAASDSFEGARVDRRYVVVAVPVAPLERGATYTFSAVDSAANVHRRETEVTVAEPFALTDVTCGWYLRENDSCVYSKGVLASNRPEVHLQFNNTLGLSQKELARRVSITPFVRNLTISREGWHEDARLVMTGDFRPSVSYRIAAVGLRDALGQPQAKPIALKLDMAPLGASVTMPEGRLVLDAAHTKKFAIKSRNVKKAKLSFWKVDESDVAGFREALEQVERGALESRPPDVKLPVTIAAKANTLVETTIDLSQHLKGDASWLATVEHDELAFGAPVLAYPRGSAAARPPVALIKPGDAGSVGVHVHSAPGSTVVHVASLGKGEPVVGADVSLASMSHVVKTDAQGVAVLRDVATTDEGDDFVVVKTQGTQLLVPLARVLTRAEDMFPELASAGRSATEPLLERVVMTTDRGIYRPGATIRVKGSIYQPRGSALTPLAGKGLRMLVLDPTGKEVCRAALTSSKLGSAHSSCKLGKDAKIGMHRVQLTNSATKATYGETSVRVAEFEPPRFKVDVEAQAKGGQLDGEIVGRYLFGAAMSNAWVQWQLTRSEAPFASGALTEAGLTFRRQESWWEAERSSRWVRVGESTLDGEGRLKVAQALSLDDTQGPQRFTLEADVADKSYRHVAGRAAVVVHPAERYAGMKIATDWVKVGGSLPVELGVIDREGRSVPGQPVTARLLQVDWRHVRRRGPGGSAAWEWRRHETEVSRCTTQSDMRPVSCALRVARSGDFRVVAVVDGREGGSRSVWAWGDGDKARADVPSGGRVVQVSLDKGRYNPGDKARVVVRNPYAKATAILTVEQGGLLHHESKRVEGPAAVFDVAVEAENAPQMHVTATLVPIGAAGAEGASFRVGAATIPVNLSGTELGVAVKSDKARYQPGEMAEITLKVEDGGAPQANAEVTLAVVDEGVLRLTNFRQPNPIPSLRPAINLEFAVRDSRGSLAELFERSHVAGDGGSLGSLPDTRRNFVETALWKPVLRTNAKGEVKVRFQLPDNLTEFRMMALALDDEGKGGTTEGSFVVHKPVLLEPVLPRFAHVGDKLELAAMVHNNTDKSFEGTALIDGAKVPLKIAARGRQRVAVTTAPAATGVRRVKMAVVEKSGATLDAVERSLRVAQAGVDQHPALFGAFEGEQTVRLKIPKEAQLDEGGTLQVTLGEHMWPELGERIEYLLRYPHGCVEQTTSSTLPLLAAREIFPRIGADHHGEEFYRERVAAGLTRLASMRTASGGLAYWPGDSEPNLYGTAYAMRAFVIARAAKMRPPEAVMTGMQEFLRKHVLLDGTEPDVRALIALSLSELDALPAGILDSLYAGREKMSPFGLASLALALGSSDRDAGRADRVLDEVEAAIASPRKDAEYGWYGSALRTEAMAVSALTRLRPGSLALPALVRELAQSPGSYATQSTAYSLLALADHLKAAPATNSTLAVALDDEALEPKRLLQGGGRVYEIPLASLRGRERALTLRTGSAQAVGYVVRASYRMPLTRHDETLEAASGTKGPDVYRLLTEASGEPLDLKKVRAGQLVRVALLIRVPDDPSIKRGYLAITDRLPAGFEPVQPDLATVATAPDVSEAHPLYDSLRYASSAASHVELRDDRVQIYFDRIAPYAREVVATYLARATTPGTFALPPASAELMYQADSESYSASDRVVILSSARGAP